MTDKYAEIRAALDGGPTPGPWSAYISGNTMQVDSTPQASGGRPCVVFWPGFDGNDLSVRANAKNTRYIAAANPEAIRALLAERDALREAVLNVKEWDVGQAVLRTPMDFVLPQGIRKAMQAALTQQEQS